MKNVFPTKQALVRHAVTLTAATPQQQLIFVIIKKHLTIFGDINNIIKCSRLFLKPVNVIFKVTARSSHLFFNLDLERFLRFLKISSLNMFKLGVQ